MTYTIETRRINTAGHWLTLGNYRCDLEVAKSFAQDISIELQRETRVVTYKNKFRIHAEFSATGQPLRLE
jgi:uncharacterized protein involved in high-affinity Fe2+ transport